MILLYMSKPILKCVLHTLLADRHPAGRPSKKEASIAFVRLPPHSSSTTSIVLCDTAVFNGSREVNWGI